MYRIAQQASRIRQIAPWSRSMPRIARTLSGMPCSRHCPPIKATAVANRGCSWLLKRSINVSAIVGDQYSIIKTPSFAESITEGDVKWEKGVGDTVQVDDLVAEIETDKTSIPVPSPFTGIIEELLVQDGEKVMAGSELCRIRITDKVEVAPSTEAAAPAVPSEPVQQQKVPAPPTKPLQTDVSGPIPSTLPPISPLPSQPMGQAPPLPPVSKPAAMATPSSLPAMTSKPMSGTRDEHRVKVSRMRQRIAERLKEAQNTNAMLTTFNEVDMSRIIAMRSAHKDAFLKKHGVKLGFMSPFVKAACFALQDQPVVNAVIEEREIVYRNYVDVSCAVATPKGLVVPVLRNVESMGFADIERELNSLASKAREGTLAIEDMVGGTFTISNGGVYGSMFGTPIINPPQSAILGMHATQDRPMAIEGKVEIRPMMYIALTYDHRLIDGREAVTFLKKIKSAVEDPTTLLLDL